MLDRYKLVVCMNHSRLRRKLLFTLRLCSYFVFFLRYYVIFAIIITIFLFITCPHIFLFSGKCGRTVTYTFRRSPSSRICQKYMRRLTSVPWKTQWGGSSRGNPGLKPVRICVNI